MPCLDLDLDLDLALFFIFTEICTMVPVRRRLDLYLLSYVM